MREANGALVAELRKPPGNTIELGLEPGAYVVAMDSGATMFQANSRPDRRQAHAAGRRGLPPRRPARNDGRARRRPDGAGRPGHWRAGGHRHRDAVPRVGADVVQADPVPARQRRPRRRARLLVRLRRRQVAPRARLSARARVGADRSGSGRAAARGGCEPWCGAASKASQIAAGINVVRGTGRGLQLVGGGNVVDGSYEGAQIAGGINTVSASDEGLADGRRRQLGGRRTRPADGGRREPGAAFHRPADGAGQLRGDDGRSPARGRQRVDTRPTASASASSTRPAPAAVSSSASSTSPSMTTVNRSRSST